MKAQATPPARPSRPAAGTGMPAHIKAAAVLRNRAVALVKAGQPQQAERLLQEAIDVFPGFAEAEIRIGNIRRDLNDGEAALVRYRRALAIKPDYAWAHLEMAICLQRRGEAEVALDNYRLALRYNPKLYKTVLFALVNQPRGPFWLNFAEIKRVLRDDRAHEEESG